MTATLNSLMATGLALAASAGWASSFVRARRERRQFAAQLHNARQAAATDALTGLPNRAALTARLADLAGTGGWCLAMADLDHFKTINDTLGHGTGDRVLSATAARLAETLPEAMVARLGGDEFAIILSTGLDGALPLLEHAVAAVARPQQARGLQLTVGCSVGVADYTPGMASAELMRRADTALYDAKQTRGRAAAWTSETTPPVPTPTERRQTRPRPPHTPVHA
ncbi:GGDEF domain-containing protein [Catellatospora sp. NPDC049609]|uniref:GGDEF domain-containing protein n=1 Tax=Catellatospora sp. NPDC049609 TaxID=3155505 RepID=UPI0034368EDD